ncbi:hypothetical protein KZ483_25620 [Paenibacillus sp. sptzw28]|uniref:hypothetical protein n=1 Tax=Paenibacillus sp. sptzw28 TaxID=715179 RepID=UPI001C6F2BDD|nr:hypothetical protein [Paenibacillus sp. sptzw28]QYR21062.1 hypothetical protein KZ483_25620 [Paenibacillus sp. sptzw28]
MKIWGVDLSVIIIALVTAYIGYQFNHRSKKREAFLKELSSSYNEIYSPMFEQLSLIVATEEKSEKLKLIDTFVQEYAGKDSKIRLIASSFILDYFHNLRRVYFKYKEEESRVNELELLEKINGLYPMIEDEYWNAHDTIYEDHKQFISDTFNNPFFVVLSSIFKIVYHLSVFVFWISAVIFYFTIARLIVPLEWVPQWWNITYALLLVLVSITFFGIMMMFKEMLIKKNRRKSRISKNLKKKIKRIFAR